MADCELPPERDEDGCIVLGKNFYLAPDCTLPAGVCLSVDYDADEKTLEKFSSKILARESSRTVAQVSKDDEKSVSRNEPNDPEIKMADAPKLPDSVLPALPADPAAAVGQAQEVALTAANDIAPLLEAAPGGAGVAAALIAVAGGGAAFKFYTQWNKNKHEENMERLRLESEKSETDHTKCAAERVSLVAKIDALSAQLAEMEKKQKSLSLSVGDDLEDRLEAIEKKLAPAKRKAPVRRKRAED